MDPLEAKKKKKKIDSKLACSEDSTSLTKLKLKAYRQSYSEKHGMPRISLCLNEFGGTCLGGRTHIWTLESS